MSPPRPVPEQDSSRYRGRARPEGPNPATSSGALVRPATEALRRVVAAHVEVGEWVVFAFGDPADEPQGAEESEPEPAFLVDLIRRGQSEGGIAADLDPVWVVNVVWALVFTGMEQVQAGRLSRHAVAATVIRTLEDGVLARA